MDNCSGSDVHCPPGYPGHYYNDEPDAAITVYGEDCRVSIKVGRYVLYTDFTWCRLKTALMLIWTTLILEDDAFYESNHRRDGISFLIKYDGKSVGEGFLVDSETPPHAVAVLG